MLFGDNFTEISIGELSGQTHRGNARYDLQGFPTGLTPRVIPCCIVRILEECRLGKKGHAIPDTNTYCHMPGKRGLQWSAPYAARTWEQGKKLSQGERYPWVNGSEELGLHQDQTCTEKIKVFYTLNKKSLNGPGKSMVTVMQKEFLVQWRNFHDFAVTVFSWVNQEICISSFQQGKYCVSKSRG